MELDLSISTDAELATRAVLNTKEEASRETVKRIHSILEMKNGTISKVPGLGRWPANVIIDGSREAVEGLGHATRYFYIPKASKKDRGEGNTHPTVKPTDLMKYLVRLITPKGGIVLDPFMGSGTTGVAAKSEGFSFLGIEREPDYLEIARTRINGSE